LPGYSDIEPASANVDKCEDPYGPAPPYIVSNFKKIPGYQRFVKNIQIHKKTASNPPRVLGKIKQARAAQHTPLQRCRITLCEIHFYKITFTAAPTGLSVFFKSDLGPYYYRSALLIKK